jgi:protein-S-isoprenylcysteine O-methyltransferase Ste14
MFCVHSAKPSLQILHRKADMEDIKNETLMRKIFKLRGLLMVPPMIFIVLCTWGEIEKDWLIFGLGGTTFALGLALRVWAQMHIRYRLKIEKILTTTGPYSYVRNPLYIANTIMLVAACMFSEQFWFIPIQILYCAIVYNLVVRFEENHLLQKYGNAYLDYTYQVPRWFPRLRSLSIKKKVNVIEYLIPSIVTEAPNLLILAPFIIKDVFFC